MNKSLKNPVLSYLFGSSVLFIYIYLCSGIFGNAEETSYQYPFYIPFSDFRYFGFPIIFITGAILYLVFFLLLRLSPKFIYLHILLLVILFSYFSATYYFQAPLLSGPFYILLIGGILFFLIGSYMKNIKLIYIMFMGSIIIWIGLMVLPPIL